MRVLFLILLSATLAGCADEPTSEAPDDGFSDELDDDLRATEDTGVIRGIVVDFAIVPVAGATVTLAGVAESTQSNEDGAFGFDGLAPGTYFLEVSKLGYNATQTSVEVQAAVDTPPIVKVRLESAPLDLPYVSATQYSGFLACGAAVFATSVGCTVLAPLGDATQSVSIWRHQFESPRIQWTQGELVWDQTQPAGGMFIWEITGRDNDHIGYRETTTSPALAYINETIFADNPRDIVQEGVDYRFFGGPHPACHGIYGFGCGVTLDQAANAYIHDFYNFIPPEGWRFTSDGEVPIPS